MTPEDLELRRHYHALLRPKPRPAKTLRNAIQDMRPLDALEYVLQAYEDVAGDETAASAAARLYGLTAAQAVVFVLLHRQAGRLVSLEALAAVMEAARPNQEAGDTNTLRARVCAIRKRVAGQFTISNVHGAGYVLQEVTSPHCPAAASHCSPPPSQNQPTPA